MKRISSWLLIVCIIFSLSFMTVSCSDTEPKETKETAAPTEAPTQKPTEEPTEAPTENEVVSNGKTVDIYIIAGQSNAAGYTKIDSAKLKELWPDCYQGYDSVLYAGRVQNTTNNNTPQVSYTTYELSWQNAKAGQGLSATAMGAEVGMAKVLAEEYYNHTAGQRLAGFIKFAHGGTCLLNKTTGNNAASGNWVSPGYAESLGVDYSGLTGGLYRLLLEQVEKNIGQLKAEGYEVNIKGLFWMQGESDRSNPQEYKTAFTYFSDDIRRDLGQITGEDLSKLPIIIGEISRTSGSADMSSVQTNADFIEAQRFLARALTNVYTVESSQFDINTWDAEGGKNVVDSVQKDGWHWNTENMFNIGTLVGQCIIENILE